jgi:hypothetical protein
MSKEVKVENQTEERSLTLFKNKCDGSKKTQDAYLYQLNRFKKWSKIDTYDGLLQAPDADLVRLLEDYVIYLKERVSPNTIPIIWSAIKKFYRANKKKLDFESVEDLFPKRVKKSGKEAYSDDDMKTMSRHALKKRTRALLHFIASSGCREGAIPPMQMQHVENIGDGCKAVRIYGEEMEEYWAYLTPEASKALEEYWDERKKHGEHFKEDSPVFRADYVIAISPAEAMKETQVQDAFRTLAQHITSRKKVTTRRYNIQIVHGVRKWNEKKTKGNSGLSYSTTEKLAGRNTYLDREYYPITKEEGFEQFKKVMADLTIDDTERKNLQIEKQQKEITKLEADRKKVVEQDKRIEELQVQGAKQDTKIEKLSEKLLALAEWKRLELYARRTKGEDTKLEETLLKAFHIEEVAQKPKWVYISKQKRWVTSRYQNQTDGSKKLSVHNSNGESDGDSTN